MWVTGISGLPSGYVSDEARGWKGDRGLGAKLPENFEQIKMMLSYFPDTQEVKLHNDSVIEAAISFIAKLYIRQANSKIHNDARAQIQLVSGN